MEEDSIRKERLEGIPKTGQDPPSILIIIIIIIIIIMIESFPHYIGTNT